jgi:hypothetical protein
MWGQLIHTLSSDFVGVLRNLILENSIAVLGIVSTIMVSDCHTLGVKGGALLRKTMGF